MRGKTLKIKAAVGHADGERKPNEVKKRFRADGLVGFSAIEGATRLQTAGEGDNFEVEEDFDTVAAAFAGEMVVVTALHCVDDTEESAKTRPVTSMALNPDKFTYRPHGKGAVISIEGVPRDLVVKESVAEIDAMIDGQ